MSTVRDLYERFRQLIHEGLKFIVIGAIGAAVTFGVANALQGVGKYKAITIATILATIITYLGNKYWSFRHRQGQGTARDTSLFFLLNAVGLVIYYVCIWLIVDVGGLTGKLWYNVALVVGTGLGTLFRFWSYRKWVWTAIDGGPVPANPPAEEGLPPAEGAPGASEAPARRPGPRHRAPAGRR